jgi:hypothetical protein
MVYMDEAGTSANEPVAIVAAIVVHGDDQWRPAVEYLNYLLNRYVPVELRDDFIFHALELYTGGKHKEYKNSWPFAERLRLMGKILAIPRKFDLPVVFGYFRHEDGDGVESAIRHQAAFAICLKKANDFIKVNFPNENGMVIAENVEHMRQSLERMPELFKGPGGIPQLDSRPYDAIIDEIFFVKKRNAPLLQIADHVAFALRRSLAGFAHAEKFINAMYSDRRLSAQLSRIKTSGAGSGVVSMTPKSYHAQGPTTYSGPFSSYSPLLGQSS